MAFPMQFDNSDQPPKETGRVETVTKSIIKGAPSFMEQVITWTMVGWYFFFSGLAVLLGRPIPKWWRDIGLKIDRQKVSQVVQKEVEKPVVEVKPNRFKVVDLETNRPLRRPNGSSIS